jgi:hypothetical protein
MSRVSSPNLSRVSKVSVPEDNRGPQMDSRPTKLRGKCDQHNPKIIPLYVYPTTLGPTLEGLSPLPFRT